MFFSRTTNCYDDIKFMKNKMSRMMFTKKTYDVLGKKVTQFCSDEHKKNNYKKKQSGLGWCSDWKRLLGALLPRTWH